MNEKLCAKKRAVAYDLVKERLAQQLESVKNLDIKASITLAVIGVIFSGYLQSVIEHVGSRWLRLATLLTLTLAGVCAVKTFVQARNNEWSDWRNDPNPVKLLETITNPDFDEYNDNEVTDSILSYMAESYKHNKALYRQRYRYLYMSLSLVLVAVIIIGMQIIFEV